MAVENLIDATLESHPLGQSIYACIRENSCGESQLHMDSRQFHL